ncbi:MAG TPA: sigma 54-interacting transcriptional regulator [Pyrinomonadaceae bacterium]|nr:sigma 54-interacting transcriptional regulator [Pyrinomonadaceae bacterium]
MPEETPSPETQTADAVPRARRRIGESERAQIILEVTRAVVSNLNLRDLLRAVSECLQRFFSNEIASLVLYEEESQRLRVLALHPTPPGDAIREGALLPLDGTPPGLAIRTRAAVLRERVDFEEFCAPEIRLAYESGLRSGCSVPLISHERVLGTINLGSMREAAFTEADVELLRQIADPVAIAVENTLNFESATKERERVRTLLEVNNAIATNLNISDLLRATSGCLHAYFKHDFSALALYDDKTDSLHVHAFDRARPDTDIYEGEPVPVEGTLTGLAFTTRRAVYRSPINVEETHAAMARRFFEQQGLQTFCCVPLISHGHVVGVLTLGSRQPDAMTAEDVDLLERIAGQVAIGVENSLNFERAQRARERARLLLEINNAVVSHLDLKELVKTVSASLGDIMPHDAAGIALYEPEQNHLREYTNVNYKDVDAFREGDTIPLEGTPAGEVFTTGRPKLIRRPDPEAYPLDRYSRHPAEGSPKSALLAVLASHGRKLGIAGVSSTEEDMFDDEDLELFAQITGQIAIAVENALNFEHATKERERAETLLRINNAITTSLDLRELLHATSDCLRRYFKHDLAGMALYDAESGKLRVHTLESPEPSSLYVEEGFLMPLEGSPAGTAFTTRRTVLVKRLEEWEPPSPVVERALAAGIRSSCNAPLVSRERTLGAVVVASRREEAFTEEDAELLGHVASQFAIAVENALQYREIEGLKNKLASEKLYLEEEIKAEYNFGEIVGQSRALKSVLEQIKTVAPTDSVVLVCGETGTGKELIARAVHDLSSRRERTMVKVNCAAIPTGLLESEFFGHERGAFTGAITQRAGRFELANKGTLFLDEVGEIPLELQPKLLRVLQEQEFERLGGSKTIKVDVRLIAATNCNLREMVAEKKFRSDLFYRLNVFPVLLPPLRERAEDIPLLAGYFAQKHSRRMNKRIDAIPSETVEALCRYRWPGNVRELENFIERAVILTRGHELQAPLAELESPVVAAGDNGSHATTLTPAGLLSLADAERAHIEGVLRHTKGVVGGRGGAAEILGLPISTLRGRMKKLGLM